MSSKTEPKKISSTLRGDALTAILVIVIMVGFGAYMVSDGNSVLASSSEEQFAAAAEYGVVAGGDTKVAMRSEETLRFEVYKNFLTGKKTDDNAAAVADLSNYSVREPIALGDATGYVLGGPHRVVVVDFRGDTWKFESRSGDLLPELLEHLIFEE